MRKRIAGFVAGLVIATAIGAWAMGNLTAIYQDDTNKICVTDGLKIKNYTYATLPTVSNATSEAEMEIIYCKDCNAGNPGFLMSNSTNWVNVDDLAAASGS